MPDDMIDPFRAAPVTRIPRPAPRRLQHRKRMAIVAGFKCSDGILLASDTLYSGAVQNQHGPKLWVLHDNDPVVVFGGAARSVAALTRARDEIRRKIRPGSSLQRTLDMIDDVLKKVNEKFSPPGDCPDVQALVVIRAKDQDGSRLYQNVASKVALSPVDAATVCVGVDSLGDYFAESLFNEGMALRWAKVVAAHLVWNCKRYASGYCGGDTNFIEIPNEGPPITTTDQAVIREYEAHLSGMTRALQAVLPDGKANEETLLHRVKVLSDAISAAERSFL